jgi:hypothetical protein
LHGFSKNPRTPKPKKPKAPKVETGDNVRLTGDNERSSGANGSERDESSLLFTLNSSLSSLSSSSNSDSSSYSADKPPAPPVEIDSVGQQIKKLIARYCERWKQTHGDGEASPPIVGKDAGIFARLVKSISADKLLIYLDAYFQMPDGYVIKAKHPVELFESKLKEIAAFSETKKFISQSQVRHIDSAAATGSQLKAIREGRL